MKSSMVRISRKIGLAFVFAAAASSAHAVCTQSGQVVRVQVGVTTAAATFVYLKNAPLSGVTFVGNVISSSPFVQAAITAAATGTRVMMTGNAATCPSLSAGQIGTVGTITTFIVNP